jgi:hypothetical protein
MDNDWSQMIYYTAPATKLVSTADVSAKVFTFETAPVARLSQIETFAGRRPTESIG